MESLDIDELIRSLDFQRKSIPEKFKTNEANETVKKKNENDYYTEEKIKEIKKNVGEILGKDVSDKSWLEMLQIISEEWENLGKIDKNIKIKAKNKSKKINYKINGERKRNKSYF